MKLFYRTTCLLMLTVGLAGCAAQGSSTAETGSLPADTETAAYEVKGTDSIESEGFSEPEEALVAYLMGLKEMDLAKMIGSFAVESYIRNMDFQKNIEHYGEYSFDMDVQYPNTNPLQESINIESRRSNIVEDITNQYLALGDSGFEEAPFVERWVIYPVSQEHPADEFLKTFDEFLDGIEPDSIKILGFISPEKPTNAYINEINKELLDQLNAIYGSDKIESHVIVFEIHGDKWMMCADTVNYGGKWYIMNLQGNIDQLVSDPLEYSGVMPILDWDSEWEEKLVPVK